MLQDVIRATTAWLNGSLMILVFHLCSHFDEHARHFAGIMLKMNLSLKWFQVFLTRQLGISLGPIESESGYLTFVRH